MAESMEDKKRRVLELEKQIRSTRGYGAGKDELAYLEGDIREDERRNASIEKAHKFSVQSDPPPPPPITR